MKVKTNVRAGSQKRSGGSTGGTDNPIGSEDPVVPAPVVPPISRCVGL
jgi:hypothetical protein